MRLPRSASLVALALAVPVVLAGCGGTSPGVSVGTTAAATAPATTPAPPTTAGVTTTTEPSTEAPGTSTPDTSEATGSSVPSQPDFAFGLTVMYAPDGDNPGPKIDQGYADCVAGKLPSADRDAVAAIKRQDDVNALPDAVGVRVVKAGAACNLTLTRQKLAGGLAPNIGIPLQPQQADCVGTKAVDALSALDDSKLTGNSGEEIANALKSSFPACLTVEEAIAQVLEQSPNGIPAAKRACIAKTAAAQLTWDDLMSNSSKASDAVQAATTTCLNG